MGFPFIAVKVCLLLPAHAAAYREVVGTGSPQYICGTAALQSRPGCLTDTLTQHASTLLNNHHYTHLSMWLLRWLCSTSPLVLLL